MAFKVLLDSSIYSLIHIYSHELNGHCVPVSEHWRDSNKKNKEGPFPYRIYSLPCGQ